MDSVKKLTFDYHANVLLNTKPIETAMDLDLSPTWKLAGRGEPRRIPKHPAYCHICCIEDKDLEVANTVRGERWCEKFHSHDPTFKCYHKEFLDNANVDRLRNDFSFHRNELKYLIPELELHWKRSKIN